MAIIQSVLAVACLAAAALVAAASGPEFTSPCPEQFAYETTDKSGQWTGALRILSEDELHGLWIRVKFDKPIKEIALEKEFGGETVSRSPLNDEFLIKNPNYVLKKNLKTDVKVTVKYEGKDVPRLIGYRLNAKTICPEKTGDAAEVFENDVNAKDFISQVLQPYTPSKLPTFECGLSKDNAIPWQAALLLNQGDKPSRFLCEATLITPKHVLTAAHCVYYLEPVAPGQITVALGKSDLKHDVKARSEAAVARITVHPGYKFANLVNDIAIVELQTPVAIDDTTRPICLPQEHPTEAKKSVLVGYKLEKNINVESKLDSLPVKEITSVDCEKRVPQWAALVGDNVNCATYTKDESGCVGDSGSPLASLRATDNRWELRGVVTLGVALQNKYVCDQSATVLLADVAKHRRWISQATL